MDTKNILIILKATSLVIVGALLLCQCHINTVNNRLDTQKHF